MLELVVVLVVVVFGVAVVLVGVESPAQGAAPASALLPGVVVAGLVVAPLVSVLVESVAGLVVVVLRCSDQWSSDQEPYPPSCCPSLSPDKTSFRSSGWS